jgi:hypothetical protein
MIVLGLVAILIASATLAAFALLSDIENDRRARCRITF